MKTEPTMAYHIKSAEEYLPSDSTNTEFSCSELGSYSIDTQGNFYNNNKRELRSLIPDYISKLDSDLTADFNPSLPLSHSNLERPLDSLLYWIVLNKEKIPSERHGSSQAKQLDAEFVFATGTMKKFLATVYTKSYKQPWKMYAVKYNGTIYIINVEDKNEVAGPPREPKLGCRDRVDEVKKISYMGTQFEELISEPITREPQGEPADREVNGRQGFYSVKRGSFASGRHLVLTRAQVDFAENDEYMECKLCLEYTGRDEWKFPMYKLRDWWYHMYAGDMKQVIYGIRDGPRLRQVSRVTQSEIPNQVKYSRMSCPPAIESALRSWNPHSSIGFVDDFLQWLKGVVEDGYGMERGRAVQYVLEWEKGSSSISYSREEVRMSNFVLLPDWYIREMSAFFA